jgi:tetratricopeptide (TPR) repeat protein
MARASRENPESRAASQRGRLTGAALILTLLTFAVFHPVLGFGFLGLDDPRFVTANKEVQEGLCAESLRWAFFTTTHLGFYAPVTALSHMVDCQIYGLRPWGHHLTNLLLHAASAILLLLALFGMTEALWPSFWVAALFAVHPLHVEPVAWIAERKELLCGFFWMVAVLAYGSYARAPSLRRYGAVTTAYLLALLSKPMAVTLPLTLLLLDLWPLRRWPGDSPGPGRPAPLRTLLLEKLPLLLPIPLLSLATLKAQSHVGALGSSEAFPLGERVANALYAYGTYLLKAVAPVHLAALYPFEHGAMPFWKPMGGALALLCGTAGAVLLARKRRYVAMGWPWFVGTLVPVIGLVHVGSQAMADRYTYIPLVGIFVLVAWGAAEALGSAKRRARCWAAAVAGGVVVLLGATAYAQTLTWKDDETLYTRILRVSPRSVLAYYNLGNLYLFERGDPEKARGFYEKALAVDPGYGDVHLNLGIALVRQGKTREALDQFRDAARLKPDLPEARLNLATALMRSRLFPEAADAYGAYLALRPDDSKGHSGLGLVYGEMGDWERASAALSRAADLAPGDAATSSLLGYALLRRGDRDGARRAFGRALSNGPSQPQPYYYLGLMALEAGDIAGAQARLAPLNRLDPAMARSLEEQIGRKRTGGR